jgi:DNA polymerase III delta prime subunit
MKWSGIGHDRQKQYLERLITAGRLSHAYLFAGPDGIGKCGVAEDIIRVLVPQKHTFDVMRLVPEQDSETGKTHDIPIEETKKLKSWILLRPTGAHKAVVIDRADRLGDEAANNLLKILEEPPAYAHFFLITAKPGQVLPTIVSRCERIDFQQQGAKQWSPELLEAVKELSRMTKATVAQKIIYAKKLADDELASDITTCALALVHDQLTDHTVSADRQMHLAPVARGLLDLADVLAQPQYNRRLAIEHFLLSL